MHRFAYLLYLVGLQEIAGFFEVGLERFRLQLCLDGRFMFGVHLFFGGDLRAQEICQTPNSTAEPPWLWGMTASRRSTALL